MIKVLKKSRIHPGIQVDTELIKDASEQNSIEIAGHPLTLKIKFPEYGGHYSSLMPTAPNPSIHFQQH